MKGTDQQPFGSITFAASQHHLRTIHQHRSTITIRSISSISSISSNTYIDSVTRAPLDDTLTLRPACARGERTRKDER